MKLCLPVLSLFVTFVACSTQSSRSFEQISAKATENGLILSQPSFEQSPEAVVATVDSVLVSANAALDAIAGQDPETATFESTFVALDSAAYPMMTVMNRYWLMKETRQEPEIRKACTNQVQRLSEWGVEVEYREDLYQICREVSERIESGDLPKPGGEDAQLYRDIMRDYRRAGFNLNAATREKVAKLKNKLSKLESDFDSNITNASVVLEFPAEELNGVSESFLESSKTDQGRHAVRVTVTPDYMAVMEKCSVRKTRRKVNAARYSIAMEENGPILNKMVRLRSKMATLLGYSNWADCKIEPKMASTGGEALGFAEGLARGLQPKFDAEVSELQKLMAKETGKPNAQIQWWDFRYYQNQLMKSRYSVDSDVLRNYFPLKGVIAGMFDVYQHIFDLRFTQVEPGYKWVDDLELWAVEDATTGEAMGMFYLDLYPRPGKYNHFAQFDIIGGKLLDDGRYQRPVVSLVCNFTPGVGDDPALMNHGEVETIFHEFGHAMHSILTRAKYQRFSGANVARDFVEAPSQMFEAWVWDPEVLQRFAIDWRDGESVIPMETLANMKKAKLATVGVFYRRQMGLALADLRMHVAEVGADAGKICNAANAEVLFEPPANTNFAAYWGHLTGYDAGYYGYGWADSIAADMGTIFENAPNRFLDKEVGMRLRNEIYSVGGSRDADISIIRFLGRERSNDAFLESIGIE